MGLCRTIEDDIRTAMKAGDSVRLSALRMALSAIKMLTIEKNIKEPSDGDVLQILQRQIKQHRESIEQFERGKRQDLVEKERKELAILEAYMPEQLGEEELVEMIKAAIKETGAATKADIGRVMKAVMEKAKGRADGKIINQLVAGLLK